MSILKHDHQQRIDKLVRKHAWTDAIVAAVAWSSSTNEPGSARAPADTVRRVAASAAQGDGDALDTIIRIIRQEFRDCGAMGITGDMETEATAAINAIGRPAVPLLLPLLDDQRWMVASHAATALGVAGDTTAAGRLAAIWARTSEQQRAPGAGVDMWRNEMRSACGVALMNLFVSDPEGYAEQAMKVQDPKAREILVFSASSAASAYARTHRGAARAIELVELAAKIGGNVVRPAGDADDVVTGSSAGSGATKLSIEVDQREIHPGDTVTGRARLRDKHDRLVCIAGAALSVDLDGTKQATLMTDSRGEARFSVPVLDAGHHTLRVVYDGGTADGRARLASEQSYGITAKMS